MNKTTGRFLLLLIIIITLTGCGKNIKNEMWQEIDGSSIINFLDDSSVHFLSEKEYINNIGKYSSNALYIEGSIFSFETDGNVLTLDTNDGQKIKFKKLSRENIGSGIIGEWTGQEDNYLFLKNGIGFYFDNETNILLKQARYFAYSDNKIFDTAIGEYQYSSDTGSVRISINDSEKEYIKKSNQEKMDVTGFWKWKNDDDHYYFFSSNGLVIENYLGFGTLYPAPYYNGNIYSIFGKQSYDIKDNELLVHLNFDVLLFKENVIVDLIEVPNTSITGKWRNNPDLGFDEIEFFKDGIVIFKNTKSKICLDYIYNNGKIYETFNIREGKVVYHYNLDNDVIALKKVSDSLDLLSGKVTQTVEDKEYKFTKSATSP